MAKVTYKTKNKDLYMECRQYETSENVKFFYRFAVCDDAEKATIIVDNDDGVRHILEFTKIG